MTSFMVFVPSFDIAKEFVNAIGQKFKESNKKEIENLMTNFTDANNYDVCGVRDYILRILQIDA